MKENKDKTPQELDWDHVPCQILGTPGSNQLVAVAQMQLQTVKPVPELSPLATVDIQKEMFEQCGWETRQALWDALFGEYAKPIRALHSFFFSANLDHPDSIDYGKLRAGAEEAVNNLNQLIMALDRRPNRERAANELKNQTAPRIHRA